jgi:hypothetical protein
VPGLIPEKEKITEEIVEDHKKYPECAGIRCY